MTQFTFCLLFASLTLLGAEYHVTVNGSDRENGSRKAPLATIDKALSKAVEPGDIVTVYGGTYRGKVARFAASGTAGYPITLQAAKGEPVILKGSQIRPSKAWRQISTEPTVLRGSLLSATGTNGISTKTRTMTRLTEVTNLETGSSRTAAFLRSLDLRTVCEKIPL